MQFFDKAQKQQILKDMPRKILMSIVYGSVQSLASLHIYQQLELTEGLIQQAIEACWDAVKR